MKLAAQEQLLPGGSLLEKWAFAQSAGFDGIEILAKSRAEFGERLPELREAAQSGVVLSSICLAGGPFIGEFDPEKRREALERMKLLLETAPQIGARGVVTPAAYGIFSKRLPPFEPPRSAEEDQRILLEALRTLGEHARKVGTTLFFEPLNRYEDHMVNTLEQAAAYCQETGLESVKVIADLYHMNIEKAQLPSSIRKAGKHLAHVHLADSNRLEPGAGHSNFASALAALREIGFDGFMAFECRLSGPAEQVLPASVRHLRSL
ncbi:MAG TPA: sugar phosphate isomerase/epimerase family protein [Meiothermus sp.]|nr:sugar phosphate isomerase/epimerase family protein [Meiothermus sp.]